MKTTIYILSFLFLLSLSLKSQNASVKWLGILKTSKVDTVRIEAFNELAKIYAQTNLPLARRYADSALLEINFAEKKMKNSSSFYDKHKGMSYNTISHIGYQQGRFNEAIEYCLKTIRIFEKFNDTLNISRLYSSLSQILSSIGNNIDALYYIKKAILIDEQYYYKHVGKESGDVDLIGSYVNLTNTFLGLGLYDSTLHYCKKALTLTDTGVKNVDLGLVYINMGAAYGELNKFELAINYTKKALDIYTYLGLPEFKSLAYSNLSELFVLTKQYSKALEYSNHSEKINLINQFGDNLLNTYKIKATIYNYLSDSKNEILYLKKHAYLKDSLSQQNHTIQMEELKTQYETEKKEQEIVTLSKDNRIKDLQLETDAATKNKLIIIIVSITITLVLLIWLALSLSKTIKERKIAYIKLQEKNIEIQHQGEKLSQQAKLISKYKSQMNPHFVFNALNSIQGLILNNEKDKTIQNIQLLSTLMRQTLNNSENDLINLLNEIDYLSSYIEFEKQKLRSDFNFKIETPEEAAEIMIPPMMIQPFIENSIKHADLINTKNALVYLKISIENSFLKVVIGDNGKGFDTTKKLPFKDLHAIKIIQSRLALLFQTENFYFDVLSKPQLEQGTEIRFYLPLNYKY